MADDDAVEAMYQMPGTEGDSARASYDSIPLASETPADVTSRQYQADTATRAYGRIKAADLNARGIPSYTDTSGAAKPFVDDTGAPLTNSDPKNDVAYDSGGKAVKYSNRNPTLTPTVTDAYDGAPTQTDKQGNVYATPKGLPWVWKGVDPDVAAQAQQTQQDKLNQQTSNALAPYEQQAKVAASQAQRAANQSAKATMAIMTQSGASLSDPDGNPVDLKDVDGPTLKGAIQDSFDKEYAAPAANEKPWFGGGQYSSAATAIRSDIDNRKQKAMTAADTHIDALTNAQQAGDAYNEIQQQRLQLASAKLDSVNQSRLSQGMEPVSIPGLEMAGPTGNNGQAGGPSGNADANAPVASQGQAPTAIPGLEASQAEPPANPPISQEDHQKIDAALPAPAKQALAPVKTDADGKVQPEGFWATAGRAFGTKIIPSVATAVGGLAAGTLASESGPGAIAADIAGGTAAGYGVAKAQRAIMGDKWANENDAQMAANAKAHPVAAQIGTIVPFLVSILGGGGGGIARAGEEGALKLGTNTVTQAGKQAVEEAIATGTKAALPTAERVIQSAAAGARGGGGAEAQNPDATLGSVADAMAKNALAFGATGLFAPAKTILGSVLGKAPTDAAAMELAGSMYDTAIHGQPFDIKKIAEQTGANIPAFVLQNALLGFLGHSMAAKSGESGGPEAKAGETPSKPQGGPPSPIPGIEPTPSTPEPAAPRKGPSVQDIIDLQNKLFGGADTDAKVEAAQAKLKAEGGAGWLGSAKFQTPELNFLRLLDHDFKAGDVSREPMTASDAKEAVDTRLEQIDALPDPSAASEERGTLEGLSKKLGDTLKETANESESPTAEPVSAEGSRQPETQPKGTQVEYAPDTKDIEAAKETSPIDEVPDAKPGESKLAESAAKEAGVEYQGKGMGLHAFKEPETGGNFSIPEGDVTHEKVQAGRDAVKKAFADNPILGVGEHTEADIDKAIALAKTPKNEKENTAASKGAPQAGGNEPASAGGSESDEKRGGQASEISPEHAKSAVTKLRNGKLKPQFDLLQTRLEHLGPSASSTAESGLLAQVNPNTQKLEILHDAVGTADSMRTVKENWMQRGLSAEDGKKQATQWLNSAMNEELIHARQLVFERGGPQFDKTYAKIWREQIPEPIRQLVVALRNRKESDAERGAEYERMVIQQRETGTITEAHVGSPKYEEFYEALKPFLEPPQSGPMEDNIARVMTLHAEHEEPEATAENPKEAETKPAPKEEGRGPPKRKLQRQLAASKPEFYKEMAQYVAEDDTKQKATEPSEDEIKDIAQAYRDELPKSDFSSLKIADVMERAGYADQTMLQGKQHLAWMWKHGLITAMPVLDWSLVDDRTRAWGVNIHGEGPHGTSLAMEMPASIPGLESLAASKLERHGRASVPEGTPTLEADNATVTGLSVVTLRAAKPIVAFHGTPHAVDRFDSEKIGTGEGARAFGYGLYFAESHDAAEFYRKNISDKAGKSVGNTYTVQLNADPKKLLDWDKDIGEQTPEVKAAISKHPVGKQFVDNQPWQSADFFYSTLVIDDVFGRGEKAQSEGLRKLGIPGIKYLDGVSRTGEGGTSNYVMFDDSLIQITHANGKPVSLAKALAASKPERQPDTGKVGEAESPVENLTREAEQAGVVLKTDELKGLIRQDPAVMAAVRAKIKIRTGNDALYSSKPVLYRGTPNGDWEKGDETGTVWATDDADAARDYSARHGAQNPTVSALRFSPKNQLNLWNDFGGPATGKKSLIGILKNALPKDSNLRQELQGIEKDPEVVLFDLLREPEVIDALRSRGYDSVKIHDDNGIRTHDSVGIFDPSKATEIKNEENALFASKPLAVKLEELSETTGLTSLIDFIQKGLSPDDRLTQEERLRFAASGDPNAIGDARKTGMILDGVTARAARKYQQRVAALREARELISKLPEAQQLEFMLRVDEGTPIKDGPYSKVLDQFIKMDKQQVDAAKASLDSLGMDHWKNFENYQKYMVPHYFENADEASKLVDQMIREKKRMLGSTDFLKHRADMTMREVIDWAKAKGIELKPKNLNLVDAYMDRTYQQDRFFGAHEMIQAMERNGTGHWEDTDYVPKRGEKMVNNIIGNRTVEVSPASTEIVDGRVVTTPAKRKKQFFFAAEPSATIVNNYLSKGLRQDHKFIERYFQAANVLNAAQLSLSAFHGFFTGTESIVSNFALGIEKVLHGDLKGVKNMLSSPISPWRDWQLGTDIRKSLLDPTRGSELHRQIINQMVDAGFRGGLDSFYKNNHIEKFWDAIHQHKIWSTALHAPLAAIEYAAKPIMEHFVPRMKAAAVYKMAAMMLERRPNMSPLEFQRDMQEAVRSGENRFGELNYDSLHLNKVVKDIMMAVQRSVGWNWGDISELGGGVADWARFAKNSIKYGARKIGGGGNNPPDDPSNKDFMPGGKKFPRVTHRMAYVLALPLIIGFFGALLSAMFGQSVDKLKDLYFVKTGEVDDHGHPVRVVIPSYMKDFFAWTKHPVESLVNKLHPILSTLGSMLLNKDYYSVEIRHEGDPILKQILSEAKYAGKQFLPFSFTNSAKLKGSEVSTPLKIATGTGALLVAPSYAGKSDAQNLADDIVRESMPTKSRTQEAADHSALRSQLVGLARIGKGQDEMAQAIAAGKLDSKDVAYIHRQAQLTPLQASVSHLGLPDALKVEAIATPKEQQELRPMIAAKAQRAGKPMYRMSGY